VTRKWLFRQRLAGSRPSTQTSEHCSQQDRSDQM